MASKSKKSSKYPSLKILLKMNIFFSELFRLNRFFSYIFEIKRVI